MNSRTDHYVPVLKVKRGEKRALRDVAPSLRHKITPLLEVVERTGGKTLQQHLDTAFQDLSRSVRLYQRCFLDCHELERNPPQASEEVFRRATTENMIFTPVTGISRSTVDVAAAIKHSHHGLALRLTRQEFEGGSLNVALRRFMDRSSLTPSEIDLIVDLGPVDSLIVPGVAAFATAFLADVPHHMAWRTFTISACAFPSSMGGVQRNSHDLAQRADWVAWRNSLYRQRQNLGRLPMFSDCAIQHTLGVEGFDPRIMQVSASVRYTSSDDWLLIKGESTRMNPAVRQFPTLATSLVYGHLQQYFRQASHCTGCASIQDCADGAPRHGSAELLRRFGTIHHITTVVQDLAALPWP